MEISGTAEAFVAAPPALCATILRDVAAYPRWYDTLDAVRRLPDGRVEIVAGLTVATVTLVFAVDDELPATLEARQVGGDGRIEDAAYVWRLAAEGEGTRASYAFSAVAASRTLKLALRAPGTRRLVERDLIAGVPAALAREAAPG